MACAMLLEVEGPGQRVFERGGKLLLQVYGRVITQRTAVRLIKVPSFEQRWRHFPVQLRGLGPARLTRTSLKVFDGLAGLSRQCNLDMERASPPSGGASLSSSLGLQHQMSPDPEGRLLDWANQIGREILRLQVPRVLI